MWEKISELYNHIETYRCLCSFVDSPNILHDLWFDVYNISFGNNDVIKKTKCQALCISLIRLAGEVYIENALSNRAICGSILKLFEVFSSEDMWNIFTHHLLYGQDKYLLWIFIKSFSVILYCVSASDFSHRIQALLENSQENLFQEKYIYLLDFMSCLVDFNVKSFGTVSEKYTCNKVVVKSIFPISDLFQSFCIILSHHWSSFVTQFHETVSINSDNPGITRFLILWQKLIEKLHGKEMFEVFLNEQFVISFFTCEHHLNVISLSIYVDIIMQFFISNLKHTSKRKNIGTFFEAVTFAFDHNFFDSLPCDIQISGFCTMMMIKNKNSLPNNIQDFPKYDSIIVKKICFIFLNALSDIKDVKLLSNSVQKVFDFIKSNFYILPDISSHSWILDVFIDQDDILFGIMLALLRIYMILKEDTTTKDTTGSKYVKLQADLNAHAIFISFLQKIGFSHSELLSFLTSDETCFLLYLIHYLKLLLKEWDIFINMHDTLIKSGDVSNSEVINEHCSKLSNSAPSVKNLLVAYSSSSSSDEDILLSSFTSLNKIKDNFVVIKTLVRLKEAIQKLVDLNEFPYNILPLISLLLSCEKRSKF